MKNENINLSTTKRNKKNVECLAKMIKTYNNISTIVFDNKEWDTFKAEDITPGFEYKSTEVVHLIVYIIRNHYRESITILYQRFWK